MDIKTADSLKKLPPYLFVEIDKAKRIARKAGKDLIDLGIGDPDTPTPKHIIDALNKAVKIPANHKYAMDAGMPVLRQEIARWYKNRFKVSLNPDTEILPVLGSKEAIAHTPFAFLNRGDVTLVPDPGYPPYNNATILAGGKPYKMPLLEENAFLPDLKKIPASILKKAKLMFLNYPNNPTAALAPKSFLKDVVKFAKKHKIIICFDMAYSEMCYDNYRSPGILQISGAKEVAVEFHSLSKTFNMTGWRIGWVCGNKDIVAGIAKIKSNMDSGIFQAVQLAGMAALKSNTSFYKNMARIYEERRDILVSGLEKIGFSINKPKATFYIWTKIPKGKNSMKFANELMQKADIVATPGVGFGKFGEGYIRFALTQNKTRMKEAVKRLSSL
ncbi:MAG: aminotransferase class I/II-fold pyridoxal phosphate-dependent enzyme [PVC group bacterium]|nr:aminotransferase class I/II-fold pyridoxal phosphate-dependent enzyme [PVC group bacterium]